MLKIVHPRITIIAAAVAAAFVVGGGTIVATHMPTARPVAAASPTAASGSAGKLQDPTAGAGTTRTDATATRVQIPAIAVDSQLVSLSLIPGTDQLQAPANFDLAGWYTDGVLPGDIGPAVIDGHVDSRTAPGVFLHLSEVKQGDLILVTLSNGAVKKFIVDSTTEAPKNAFPTAVVYGPTPTAQLRVITCDGIFNNATGHYLDNRIVFASLVP
jgi:LPXTG-site transpeptidase (sortase) family protein